MQLPPPAVQKQHISEETVHINKFEYDSVYHQIVFGRSRGFVLAGPTGCGKTTYALLPLVQTNASVLIVQPSQVNCANVVNEFNYLMRPSFRTPHVPEFCFGVPEAVGVKYVTCTNKMFNDFFHSTGRVPNYDYIIHDEYHAVQKDNVTTLNILRNVQFSGKYILASATPPGVIVEPRLTTDMTVITVAIPAIMTLNSVYGTIFDTRYHAHRGSGVIVVAVASEFEADYLCGLYDRYTKACVIDSRTNPETFLEQMSKPSRQVVYIITPDVQAGLTLPMDTFIVTGRVSVLSFANGVLSLVTRMLDESEYKQCFGRAARVRPTCVFTTGQYGSSGGEEAQFFEASTSVLLAAHGIDVSKSTLAGNTQFPRVNTLQREQAAVAIDLLPKQPLLGLALANAVGELYTEFGGSATTFALDNAKNFKVFDGLGEFFIAPFFDLTSDLDPTAWLPFKKQQDLSIDIIAANGLNMPHDINVFADVLSRNIDNFAESFLDIIDELNAGSSRGIMVKLPEANVVGKSDDDIFEMVPFSIKKVWGEDLLILIKALASSGLQYKTARTIERNVAANDSGDTRLYCSVVTVAALSYGSRVVGLGVQLKELLDDKNHIDVTKVSDWLIKKLAPLLTTAWLKENSTGILVDLEELAEQAISSGNAWLTSRL